MVMYFYNIQYLGFILSFYSIYLVSCARCYSVLFISYSVRIILCTTSIVVCSHFTKKKKLKKRNETTQSNKKPHHRNILTEALDENINKWKNLFVPWFSLCFPILHLIAWKSDPLLNCKKNWKFYGLQRSKE